MFDLHSRRGFEKGKKKTVNPLLYAAIGMVYVEYTGLNIIRVCPLNYDSQRLSHVYKRSVSGFL